MSYSKIFNARMKALGSNSYDRKMMNKSRSFQHWFDNTLGRAVVDIDGIEQEAVIQDQNQNNNKDLSDDKYIVVENKSNIQVGSIITWRNHTWIVFTDEIKTIPTHKQAKIKESNGRVKWMMGNRISGNGLGHPAFIQNQTLYTLGVSTSGGNAWIVNAKMMFYMQDNEETRSIKIGQRIFIGGAVYQVMFKDYVSRQGLINFLLEEDFYNPSRDNKELEIADYYTNGKPTETIPSEGNENDTKTEIVITGVEKAKIGSTNKFEAKVYRNGIVTNEGIKEWTIADTESVAIITENTPNYISVKFENNFKKVGSTITIIAKGEDGMIVSKPVRVISPY